MPARNLSTIVSAIARRTEGIIPFGELVEAVNNANYEINKQYKWPWLRAEANIPIQATYSIGTITVMDGSDTVTGTLTNWDTTWLYKSILIGQTYYRITEVVSTTSLTVEGIVNQGQDFVDVGYTIFQDLYPLPVDCEFGSIILVLNPLYRYRLKYIPVYTLERQNVWFPGFFSNFQQGFSDGGRDDATVKDLIRFTPPPAAAADYRIVYRRRVPDLAELIQSPMLPRSFDYVLELMAEYKARFGRKTPMPGWMEVKQEAYQALQVMRREMATSMYDNYAQYNSYPAYEDTSFYYNGSFIGPQGP